MTGAHPAALAALALTAFLAVAALPRTAVGDDSHDSHDSHDSREPTGPKFPTSPDELSAPRLPAPFIMPDLSHESWDFGMGWMLGVATAHRDGGTSPVLALARATIEGDVVLPRRLYIGATLPFASGLTADGSSGAKTVAGNVELHGRIVFPLPSWLAFGAVFGVVVPSARYDRDSPAHAAAVAATSLEPTDALYFTPGAVALRPAMDMRIIRGPLIVQARQGIDIEIDSQTGRTVTTGRFLGHIGVHIERDLEISVEGTQVYLFDERAPDNRRTAITLGPGARIPLGPVDIGAALVTNVFAPLSPEIDRFLATRISLVVHLE